MAPLVGQVRASSQQWASHMAFGLIPEIGLT
jgi:hypothetical protein